MIHGGELIEQEPVQSTDGSNFAVKIFSTMFLQEESS